MTFEFKRYDCTCKNRFAVGASDGEWVSADDAINREAVNADKIRTLEVQLKEARLRANRLDRLLSQKNQALIEVRDIVQKTFDLKCD